MRADTYHSGEHGREGILGSLTQAGDVDNSTQAQQSILEEKKEHGSFCLWPRQSPRPRVCQVSPRLRHLSLKHRTPAVSTKAIDCPNSLTLYLGKLRLGDGPEA